MHRVFAAGDLVGARALACVEITFPGTFHSAEKIDVLSKKGCPFMKLIIGVKYCRLAFMSKNI